MRDIKVGSKVQHIEWENKLLRDGQIVAIIPPKKQRTDKYWSMTEKQRHEMETTATIKWEDGTQDDINIEFLEKRDSEIEREFRIMANQVIDEIQEKVAVAAAYLHEATELSEKHGIPFYSDISIVRQPYIPTTFSTKHGDIDHEIVEAITGSNIGYDHNRGWQHSQVC